jgi:type VI secretion system protein ImpG
MARAFSPDLDALSELAASFARAYPALAPRLAEKSADPDVERLLDAFSYLTERIHQLLDAGSPTAAQFFADMLAPELARPFPAATIVELAPPKQGGRIAVPPGAEFESIPVDGTPCRFRAWSAFEIVPWSVEDARVAWSPEAGQSLDLVLRASNESASPGGLLASLFPLRLHLGGDSRAALTLLLFLRCHLTDIELRIGGEGGTTRSLGKSVRPWGLLAEQALLPPEPFEHPGLRLLREYFVLPAKLAFVELGAVLPVVDLELPVATQVELRLRFDAQLPTALHLTRENVRLNCVPVANVFETTTDPVRPTLERPVHPLRPADLPLGHGDTYSVKRVLARVSGRAGIHPVASFAEFEAAPLETLEDVFYVARPVPSTFGGGNETHLSLGSPAGAAPVPEIEFLSVEIRAGNGTLPNALGIGDVCLRTESSPRGLTFRNISAVTPYRAPATGDELRWRTLAVTALSALPLTSARTLQTLLHVLDLHPLGDAQAARAHAQKLQAILEVTAVAGRARHPESTGGEQHGTAVVGHDVHVELSNAGFDGEGEALVFASVLASLLGHEASLGTFVRTTVRVAETGRVFGFPALHGDRAFEPLLERR